MSAAISKSVVHLLSEYTGRGPTKARTYINQDLITVVLRETLMKGERSLVQDGRVKLVLAIRKAYQNTMGPQLIAAVERHSGRRVFAFLRTTTSIQTSPSSPSSSFQKRTGPRSLTTRTMPSRRRQEDARSG